MATVRRFEDLVMFKKARELTKAVYASLASCKDYGFRDQIQRASVSIVSNIAEGFESGTKQGFLNYLYIAKASAGEVRAQLHVAHDITYLNIETFKDLNVRAEECSKLIASFIRKLKSGGLSGSQYKRELPRDIVGEMMTEAGYTRLPNGQVVEKRK
ncbi:MAG: four helix bundle protein [bacterium]|nr:four helix bundle protein [bacterium]